MALPLSDDEGVVAFLRELQQAVGTAAADALDPLGGAALVHAQAAVDPVQLDALGGSLLEQGRHEVARQGMLLLLGGRALHRVGMGCLRLERYRYRTLI